MINLNGRRGLNEPKSVCRKGAEWSHKNGIARISSIVAIFDGPHANNFTVRGQVNIGSYAPYSLVLYQFHPAEYLLWHMNNNEDDVTQTFEMKFQEFKIHLTRTTVAYSMSIVNKIARGFSFSVNEKINFSV